MKILCIASMCLAALFPAIATKPDNCIMTIDFSKAPNGTTLKGGMYLEREWHNEYGLTLSASGGLSKKPRLFDSSHPGTNEFGDPDLGSPNNRCPDGGPGIGEGGEPESRGANCKPLGNVLIIQEDNDHPNIPDDNVDGGVITFHFDKPLRVTKMGLLDIDYKTFIRVKTLDAGKTTSSVIPIPILGDNSVQTVNIDTDNVSQLDLNLRRSGAVTFLSFCYTDLVRSGEVCYGGDTCETDYCFNAILPDGTEPAGVCSCDPTTNAGCEEPKECAFSPLVDIGPPDCFLPMGGTCSNDSECVSDHCFDRQCVCNDELDFPCNEDEACTLQEGSGYMCLLKIGQPCYGGGCETNYCFNAILPDGTRPAGVCSCNPTTNTGCVEPKECAFSPLVDIGPPDCFLPVGATCSSDSECVSDHCFDSQCVCNDELDFPCDEDEACTLQEGSGYICLLKIGQPCYGGGGSCETNYCFNAILPDGTRPVGVCSCNPTTNTGCVEPKECAFSPLVDIGPPDCFLPMGASCSSDSECVSDHCFGSQCVCNEELDFPCNADKACTFQEGSGYLCRSKLLGIAEECLEDAECETENCWADWLIEPQQPGICRCNIATDVGCPDGSDCLSPLAPGSAPSCFLPVGATCADGAECFSGNCYENVCAECDEHENYPCFLDGKTCTFNEDTKYTCQTCVVPDPVTCYRDIPVVCPDGCKYPTECLASVAGYAKCRHSNELVLGPGGNLYKVFEQYWITWDMANAAVKTLSDKCVIKAHLVTITSPEEDVFVHELGRAFHAYIASRPKMFWVGGFQNVNSTTFKEPGGGWEWLNNEGNIPTPTHPINGKYGNWGTKEPNNIGGQYGNTDNLPENHMTICGFDRNPSDKAATGWDDEWPGGPIQGYIVEVEMDPTVVIFGCDSQVANLCLPSPSRECPPGQISKLIDDCLSYGGTSSEFLKCVEGLMDRLESEELITGDERDSIMRCATV